MEITIYGYILTPLLIILFLLNTKYLVYVLIFTLTLQVTSLFNITFLDNYSMQIYRFISILLSVKLLIYLIYKNKMFIKFKDRNLKIVSVYGLMFSIYSLVWSYIAPFLFENYMVCPPKLGIDFCVLNGQLPLQFSFYNIAFSIYIIFYILTLIYIFLLNWNEKDLLIIKKILLISLLTVITTSLSQIFNSLVGTIDITKYLYTTISRELEYSMADKFLNIPRVQATFLEPSMLAPFLVGMYSHYLYNSFTKPIITNIFFTIITLLLIILSTSTTAYISTFLITLIILIFLIHKKNTISVISVLFFITFGLFMIIHITIGIENLINLVLNYIIYKPETLSYQSRTFTDVYSIKLFFDTYGLGVGLGSNRPSSLIPYLLSQLGIIGSLLFIGFIFQILKLSYIKLKNSQYFSYYFLLISILIAQFIAYPDITNPTLWQFIYIVSIISLGVRKHDRKILWYNK